eukprot:CAMPEP_0114558590 /NCGR_PEP_ID=MMETSP0114-20121206/10466_1 /TAXON_ID=31324 /ORGANISM="Goniomonas sp, Strain m" /LENGTH=484 /DNA_ID=CAMNT_0001743997 /DNA_START=93 /DNA_END=1547 /DNA_ORIENTATION=-
MNLPFGSSEPLYNETHPLRVCVGQNTPMAICDFNNPQLSRADYSGFVVEAWKIVAKEMGFTDWTFQCYNFNDMIEALWERECHLEASGLAIDFAQADEDGKKQLFNTGLTPTDFGILIKTKEGSKVDAFGWLHVFDWSLWLTLLASTLFVGLLQAVIEGAEGMDATSLPQAGLQGLWSSSQTLISGGSSIDFRTWPARLIQLCFMLVILISMATYTADLASKLTVAAIELDIKGPNDLKGKVVLCEDWSEQSDPKHMYCKPELVDLGVIPKPFVWSSDDALLKAIEVLKKGEEGVVAIVVEDYALKYFGGKDCGVQLVPFTEGWMRNYPSFSSVINTPEMDAFMAEIDIAISAVRPEIQALEKTQIFSTPIECASPSVGYTPYSLRGLFYILAGGCGVALLAFTVQFALKKLRPPRDNVPKLSSAAIVGPSDTSELNEVKAQLKDLQQKTDQLLQLVHQSHGLPTVHTANLHPLSVSTGYFGVA